MRPCVSIDEEYEKPVQEDVPLPDLCALSGWKDAKTILTCYQTPDRDIMQKPSVENRRWALPCKDGPRHARLAALGVSRA